MAASSKQSHPVLSQELERLGFYAAQNALSQLSDRALDMARAAPRSPGSTTECFEAFPSYIPTRASGSPDGLQITIDIGGTSTKAAARTLVDGKESWNFLFEIPNAEMQREAGPGNSFQEFAKLLANQIHKSVTANGIDPATADAYGIVWSNAMNNESVSQGIITGIIEQREKYQKNEWFIKDLKNGDDIGSVLRSAFLEAKLPTRRFVVSNDTVFTSTALPGSDGGVVCSTGLNGTLVKPLSLFKPGAGDELVICNGELGGRMSVPPSLISAADTIGASTKASIIEMLVAGRFLPRLFAGHILTLGSTASHVLAPIAKALGELSNDPWEYFGARDLKLLCLNPQDFAELHGTKLPLNNGALEALTFLGQEIVSRGGMLCAVVVYGTVAEHLKDGRPLRVALDSRLAREIPLFEEKLREALPHCTVGKGTVEVTLLQPLHAAKGEISVPMQGAARALDRLL